MIVIRLLCVIMIFLPSGVQGQDQTPALAQIEGLRVRVGVTYPSISISPVFGSGYKFGPGPGFRIGVEYERLFPYASPMWSAFLEPAYQYFSTINDQFASGAKTENQFLDLNIGIRRYFNLGGGSRLFLNVATGLSITLTSEYGYSFYFSSGNPSQEFSQKLFWKQPIMGGVGWSRGRLAVELRYSYRASEQQGSFSAPELIFGYNFLSN